MNKDWKASAVDDAVFMQSLIFQLDSQLWDAGQAAEVIARMGIRARERGLRLAVELEPAALVAARPDGPPIVCAPSDLPALRTCRPDSYDILKIDSALLGDWPVLESAVRAQRPILASVAGMSFADVARAHLFLETHGTTFCLMFPAGDRSGADLPPGHLAFLRRCFPGAAIGLHLDGPSVNLDAVKIALAQGTDLLEIDLRRYPDPPAAMDRFLSAACDVLAMCGKRSGRCEPTEDAGRALCRARRGVYLSKPLEAGARLDASNTCLAFPCGEAQLQANDLSKYAVYTLERDGAVGEPVQRDGVAVKQITDNRPPDPASSFAITSETLGGVPCRRVADPGFDARRVLIHVHGGGYVSGSADESQRSALELALHAQRNVISVDYRLAPRHPFPAALEDVLAVYQHLLDSGMRSSAIGLFGESAGGGLALAVTMKLRDMGGQLPAAVVCSSPWADLTNSSASHSDEMNRVDILLKTSELAKNARAYAQGASLQDPYLSPAFGDFRGLPPLLIYAGTDEVLLEDAIMVARRAQSAGVDVTLRIIESMPHVFTSMTGIFEEADRAMEEVGAFLQRYV